MNAAWDKFVVLFPDNSQKTFTSRADVKLWPGGHQGASFEKWDWKKQDAQCSHPAGIHENVFSNLIDQGTDLLVLSQGWQGVLHTDNLDLEKLAQKYNIQIFEGLTDEALDAYNTAVMQGKNVVGIFHATC